MKKSSVAFSRIFVGVLFIISGLVKLNDPVGFSYKLEEYFSEPVFNIPFLMPFALAIALFIVILEIVLGVMLLLGTKPKITIWLLIILMVKFAFLTFYSAFFDKVKECGCFGDAIPLTSWQSFIKDLVLLAFILYLYFNIKRIHPLFTQRGQNLIIGISVFLSCLMGYWVINHLPIIDFRPYKVGTNIVEGKDMPLDAPKRIVDMIFVYNVNGVEKEYKEEELMSVPEGAVFVTRKDKVLSEGYIPPIKDFTIEKDGQDHADDFLSYDRLILILMYDLNEANLDTMDALEKLSHKGMQNDYNVIALTASSFEEIEAFKLKHFLSFDFYFCDGITIKTIARGNPSIVVIKKGVIQQKVHYNDIDDLNF